MAGGSLSLPPLPLAIGGEAGDSGGLAASWDTARVLLSAGPGQCRQAPNPSGGDSTGERLLGSMAL